MSWSFLRLRVRAEWMKRCNWKTSDLEVRNEAGVCVCVFVHFQRIPFYLQFISWTTTGRLLCINFHAIQMSNVQYLLVWYSEYRESRTQYRTFSVLFAVLLRSFLFDIKTTTLYHYIHVNWLDCSKYLFPSIGSLKTRCHCGYGSGLHWIWILPLL